MSAERSHEEIIARLDRLVAIEQLVHREELERAGLIRSASPPKGKRALTKRDELRLLIALNLRHGNYTPLTARIEREVVLMDTATEPYEIELRIKDSDHDVIITGVVAEAIRDNLIDQLGEELGKVADASDLSDAVEFTAEQWMPLMWALRGALHRLDALYWLAGRNEDTEELGETYVSSPEEAREA